MAADALVALRGSSAMSLAREFKPGAITLDINLPDMAGWTILDRLKHDPTTRHIPVHIISGDENRRLGLALGAMTYLEKSVTNESLVEAFETIEQSVHKRVKKLLLVCADEVERDSMLRTVAAADLDIVSVGTGGAGLTCSWTRATALFFALAKTGTAKVNSWPFYPTISHATNAPYPPAITMNATMSASLVRNSANERNRPSNPRQRIA